MEACAGSMDNLLLPCSGSDTGPMQSSDAGEGSEAGTSPMVQPESSPAKGSRRKTRPEPTFFSNRWPRVTSPVSWNPAVAGDFCASGTAGATEAAGAVAALAVTAGPAVALVRAVAKVVLRQPASATRRHKTGSDARERIRMGYSVGADRRKPALDKASIACAHQHLRQNLDLFKQLTQRTATANDPVFPGRSRVSGKQRHAPHSNFTCLRSRRLDSVPVRV